jgi:hypothetical protein
MTGCATLLFPERSIVPPSQRGGVDGILLTVDIIASVPFGIAGCLLFLGMFCDPPSMSTLKPDFFKIFYLPVAVDLDHSTLFLPKDGSGSER